MQNPESLTRQYLTGLRQIEVPRLRREGHPGQEISILGATANNLQKVDAAIPLGTFTCVTGVSGSGKSTLIIETLYKALARRLHKARALTGTHDAIAGEIGRASCSESVWQYVSISKVAVYLKKKNQH